MIEEKVYGTYMGQHSQSQGHLVKSRVVMSRLSWAMWERGNRYSSKVAKGPERERVTKMSGL